MYNCIETLIILSYNIKWPDLAVEHTSFSSTHGTFTKVNHCVEHETSLDKFQRILITENIYPDQNEMKWKSTTKVSGKFSNS